MRAFAPVIFDATHSVQMPGAAGGKSGGDSSFVPYLAKAAAAVGVDGFFMDGPNMVQTNTLISLIRQLQDIENLSKS